MPNVQKPGQYIEKGYESPAKFMSDETYSEMLDSVVPTCVDIVVEHDNKVLLGKRSRHPQADWWVIGGRMKTGETFEQTAARNLKRELSLDIDPARFAFFSIFSAAWKLRAHPPAENGTHTVSLVYSIELTESEVEQIKPNDEYVDTKWETPAEIAANTEYHEFLRDTAQQLEDLRANQ